MSIALFMDTDIGGDVDDALALAAALRSPEVRLLGISTVYLRPAWRAQVACETLRRCGAEGIPVAAGCGEPLNGAWDEKHIPDTGVLPPAPMALSPLHGSDLLLETARKHPEMNLLAVGPMTNIALALRKDAAALKRTHVYMMGGRLHSALPEWNCLCDPEALELLLSSGMDVTLVPFEWTSRSKMTRADIDAFGGSDLGEYLQGMMNAFTRRFGFLPMLHDPMALAMLLRPELFAFQRRTVRVKTAGRLTRGALVDYGADSGGNVRVVVDCDIPAFMAWILGLLNPAAMREGGARL